ncbi:hypothetical protein IOD16_08945 [Saccharothrix sp. 6-C]|uniref:hypothetical protein n=1 Tax=Saccharothrix sp. 6-C TaxID=2781735 RepID=UPI001916DB20|nr:hypothetical protein [Saccharothrix sp. 6-C]QQQ78560.1 hypothetical protein IOD16_08945 [Saccharothrix sp. 6-C]
MVDWRLIALVVVFLGFAWFARKREDWVQPILVGVAVATLFGGLLFLGIPLIR